MLLYQFNIDLDQRRRMSDVLILDEQRRLSTDSRSSIESQESHGRITESRDQISAGNDRGKLWICVINTTFINLNYNNVKNWYLSML